MRKALLAVSVFLLAGQAAWAFDFPRVESVVANPNRTVPGGYTASRALLSGTITPYAAGGQGLNYLTVSVDGKLQGGFFVVPPDLAAQLRGLMNPNQNYTVNFVYTMDRVNVNGFAPAYGVVRGIEFVDGNGLVFARLAAGQ
jgi:hypothetical protein